MQEPKRPLDSRSSLMLTLILALAGFSASTQAKDIDQDDHLWMSFMAQGPIAPSVGAYAEVQPRFNLGGNGLSQLLIRPALYFSLDPNLTLWIGYAYVGNHSPSSFHENRFWQQATYSGTYDMFRLLHRLRLEQRFFAGGSFGNGDAGFRARYLARSMHPLVKTRKSNLVVQDEIFFNLNSVNTGAQSGFDQNRFFLGVNHEVVPQFAFDVGYLGQYIRQALSARDRYRHALMVATYFYW